MKRLAILLFTAVGVCSGAAVRANDPPMAPTVPSVPMPVLVDGVPVPTGYDIRATRDPNDPFRVPGYDCPTGPRASHWRLPSLSLPSLSLFNRKAEKCPEPHDPFHGKAGRFCDDCTPACRHPLPALPAGLGTRDCAGTRCAGGRVDGDCWDRFKTWACYRQTPVHLGCVPTPRHVPLWAWFPCTETAGCGAGQCGPNGCVAGGHAGGAAPASPTAPAAPAVAGRGKLLPGRGVAGGCQPCPTPGEVVMPGYRLANPESPAVVGVPPGQTPVAISSYKTPVSTPNPNPLIPVRR